MALVSQDPDNHCEDNHPVASLGKEGSWAVHQAGSDEEGHGVGWRSIGLDKVMNGDVLRVDMVHPESADQSWANDGSCKLSPSIAAPVN